MTEFYFLTLNFAKKQIYIVELSSFHFAKESLSQHSFVSAHPASTSSLTVMARYLVSEMGVRDQHSASSISLSTSLHFTSLP
jgi:hypothetical protein